MRGPELERELVHRKLEHSEEKAVMVGRLLQAIGALKRRTSELDAVVCGVVLDRCGWGLANRSQVDFTYYFCDLAQRDHRAIV